MEAASARMAARDRYGGWGEAPTSPLQRFICTAMVSAHYRPKGVLIPVLSKRLRPTKLRTQPGLEP